jgi:peptidoglycan/LPS O-acetylase OafA/YrhL
MPGDQRVVPPAEKATRSGRQGEFLTGDGIRGIGMVCIILAHLVGGALLIQGVFYTDDFRAAYGTLPGILMSGLQLGLPMFFVLSGYLISRPWIRNYVLGRDTPSLRRYLRHRVLRIVPVFWLVGALMLLQYGTQGASPLDLATLFGFVQIYHSSAVASGFLGQAWTIDVEVAFYALIPISGWLMTVATRHLARRTGHDLGRRERIALIVSLLAVATVASAYVRGTTVGTSWNESLPATFYYFAPGVALAALELELSGPMERALLRRLAPVLGLSATAVAIGLAVAESRDSLALVRARGALAVAVGSGLALGALLARQLARGDSPRWVDNRVTRWLGARSYPCYILQSATLATAVLTVGRVGGGPWMQLLAMTAFVLPATILAGAVVHARIERPLLIWAHGQRHRTAAPRVDVAADPPVLLDQRPLAPSESATR